MLKVDYRELNIKIIGYINFSNYPAFLNYKLSLNIPSYSETLKISNCLKYPEFVANLIHSSCSQLCLLKLIVMYEYQGFKYFNKNGFFKTKNQSKQKWIIKKY